MKILTILFTGFGLLFCEPIMAQDKITDLNGNEHIVKITEITPDSVRYKEITDSVNSKVYAVNKSQLFMVTFKNGTKEVLLDKICETTALPALSKQEYYRIGKQDASTNFKSNGAFWGTFAATLVP